MNEIQIFNNPEFGEIRTVMIDGVVWFVGKDVAEILGYVNGSRDINAHVDDEDKLKYQISTAGQMREQIIINESGLYSLVLSSKLPNAKKFKHWVTSVVLPAIRKTGSYSVQQMSDEEMLCRAVLLSDKKIKALETAVAEKDKIIEEQRPKVVFAETVEASTDWILIRDLAKLIKQKGIAHMGECILRQWLRDKEYMMKARNEPTQKSLNLKVMAVKVGTRTSSDGVTHITRTPVITGKGQVYFVDKYMNEYSQLSLALEG